MRKTIRRPLVIALALSIFTTSSLGAAPVYGPPTPEDFKIKQALEEAGDYQRQYKNIEVVGEGQPRGSLPPDRFLLMEQTVFPKEIPVVKTFVGHIYRKWFVQAMLKQINRYQEVLEKDPSKIQPFATVLDTAKLEEKIANHLRDGRRTDTPLFIFERQADAAQLEQIKTLLITKAEYWASNTRIGSANPTDAPTERRVRHVNWWDLTVQIQVGDQSVKTMRMRDTATGRDVNPEEPYFCAEAGTCRFNLKKGNEYLHVFGIPANVIANFDQYVLFTHNDSYNAETGVQYISFLDLGAYNGLIGNEEIPVFRLPLKIGEPITSMTFKDKKLVLNGKFTVERGFIDQASDMQQVAFNLQASLVTPDSWAKILPLVDSVQEYFQHSMNEMLAKRSEDKSDLTAATVLMEQLGKELQDQLNAQKGIKPLSEDQIKELGATSTLAAEKKVRGIRSLELYHKRVSESEVLAKAMTGTAKRARVSRQLKARVNLLAATLISPRPFMSQKIKEALGVWYVKYSKSKADTSKTRLLDKVIELSDRGFANAGVIGAALLYAVAPDSAAALMQAGLGASTGIADYLVQAILGFGSAAVHGTEATFAAFASSAVMDQYVYNGNLYRTLVGMTMFAGFLGGLYFIPHFIFNLKQLYKDMKKPEWNGFVDRQNRFKRGYYQRLANDEALRRNFSNGTDVEFTETEQKEIHDFLAARQEEISKRRRWFGLLGPKKRPVTETIDASMEDQNAQLEFVFEAAGESAAMEKALRDAPEDFKNFWSAAAAFTFSAPALELTLESWARIWNSWASWRFTAVGFAFADVMGSKVPYAVKIRPISLVTRLLYPDFMKTAVYSRQGQITLPTEANGGLLNRCSQLYQAACNLFTQNTSPDNHNPKQHLQALKQFEKQIIDAEDQIVEVAFRQSLDSLAKYMKSKDDLKALFSSQSLDSITQKEISNLSWASQTFLRAHFQSVYEASMSKFLAETLEEESVTVGPASSPITAPYLEDASVALPMGLTEFDPAQEAEQLSLKELKRKLVAIHATDGTVVDYSFDLTKAKAAALALADDPVHFENARAAVKKGRLSPSNFAMNTQFNLAMTMDPKQNPSWARVETVHKRLESPSALGRAVRAEISKLLTTLPADLFFKLLFAAGIYEGALKPIQEEFLAPNSMFYLSSTSFYMLFASGFFMSLMANAWLKLQEDARQDDMGEFGHIPKGEDAQKGFLNWYFKQFNSKENSILKNWAYHNKLAFWNLPAALANISLFYFMFSGRLDLSLLVAGYALSFGTPLGAFGYKVDQAFERAAHYAARGVKDEKWLAHPGVQQFLTKETQRLRNRFTLFNDVWGNVLGNWTSNVEFIPTEAGTRGFQRALFGGGLLEEYIVNNALSPLQKAISGVPVVNHILSPIIAGCEGLLTHGNTDLTITPKYGPEDGLLYDLERMNNQGPGSLNPDIGRN